MIKIPDIIQLNDYKPKRFLRIIIVIQLWMLGVVTLNFMSYEIPILSKVIAFIYLTFVPGIIIIRLLNLHRLGVGVTILLSVGLSISFIMFSGFILNFVLSFLKFESPLSYTNVVIFIITLVAILSILSYRINKFYHSELPPLQISSLALYLLLLPVVSILGTYLINFYNNNILLLILIVLIALIPFLVALNKIPSELYSLSLVVIAISLLFHYSLISMYLTGWDIHTEYYTYKLVVNNAYWNSNMYSNINGMLSIAILPVVYSYFLKMEGGWIFKIVYPIIFSLVPLGLYNIYQNQIKSDKIAFYSVFFFMSFFTFFQDMLSLARQEIAELFFVLLIYLMVQDTLNKNIRNALLLIFGVSLITSHYGLSYIFIILMIIMYLFSKDQIINLKIKGLTLPEFNLKKLTLNYFVAFYIIFALLWYLTVSSSSTFESIVNIGDQVYTSIFTEFFNPENRDRNVMMALGMAKPEVSSFGREVYRGLQFITQFFIIIGFFKIIINREFTKLKAEYFYLIVASLIILFLSTLPYSAKFLNMTRIYHIALVALSPMFIVGGIFVIEKAMKIINIKNYLKQNHVISILVLGIMIPYFLFNTGFVYEITNDVPTSIPLGMERMKNDNITKVDFYNSYIPEQDVYSASWFSQNKDENKSIYSDRDSKLHVLNSYGMTPQFKIYSSFKESKNYEHDLSLGNYYIYFNMFNVHHNMFVDSNGYKFKTSIFSPIFNKSSKVYSNGYGEIYMK